MENEEKPVQPLSKVKVSSWVLRRWKVLLLLLLALFLISSFRFWDSKGSKDSLSGAESSGKEAFEADLTERLLSETNFHSGPRPPLYCKGIYMTSWIAGTRRAEELVRVVERTELNCMVIDIKDSTGRLGYEIEVPLAKEIGANQGRIRDIDGLLSRCHRAGIYAIARIVVFQDPCLAKARPEWAVKEQGGSVWRDRKGLSWMDPACREVWKYNLDLAKEAVIRGFDEIQFDYVRFPSDGKISLCHFPFWDKRIPKYEIMRQFFSYASAELAPYKIPISVDLFGLTLWRDDDLNIGQRIIDAMYYVDYICPMVYPSHYPPQFLGFRNPAEHPYEIVYQSLIRGQSILSQARARARLRPWLQDFNLGARYDLEKILLQKRAVYDSRSFGWVFWNPQNRYTEIALEPDWVGRLLALPGGEGEGWWARELPRGSDLSKRANGIEGPREGS
jgi:hypothetical protein